MTLRPVRGVVGRHALDPVGERFNLAVLRERAPKMGRPAEDLRRVEAADLQPVEFAGQVEDVAVAVLRIADRLGDLGLPPAYGRRVVGVDPALQVTGVAGGGEFIGSWDGAQQAAVVFVHAVGCPPDQYLASKAGRQDVIEAAQCRRELSVVSYGLDEMGDTVSPRCQVGGPLSVLLEFAGDTGQPRERSWPGGFECIIGFAAQEPVSGGGDGVGISADRFVEACGGAGGVRELCGR